MPKFYMISPNVRKMSLDATGLLFTSGERLLY